MLRAAIAHLRSLSNLQYGLGFLTLGICLMLGLWLFPVGAKAKVDPKLQDQVLQIIRENPQVILESIQSYRQQQEQQQQLTRQAIVKQMQANPKALIGQAPTKGAPNAKVLLLEFSDFQCPYCAKVGETLKQFMDKHGSQVTLAFKHFPLTQIHPEALPAAKAAWAAGQQGKFWEFHDALFSNQKKLGDGLYQEIAQSLSLDLQKFNRDRASSEASATIQQDIQLAEKLGVDSTPFFVMNGLAFAGAVNLADMEQALARVSQ